MTDVTENDLIKQRKKLQEMMDLWKSMNRLTNNRDFNKVIMTEFMINETARFAHVSTDPNLDDKERADALGMAQAAGYLKRYLQVLDQMGKHAEHQISQIDDELEYMRANGEDEEA